MKIILSGLVMTALLAVNFSANSAQTCRWVQGKGRVCTPVVKKKVVVVNPGHHHHNPWHSFAAVVGTAIVIDKVTGEPTVEGKDSILVETKLIEAGKVDVIEKDGKVIFIRGIG